jgi:hypothetical protein
VIEINATPAMFTDAHAAIMVEALFPPGSDGRIPSVLLVDAIPASVHRTADMLAAGGLRVGRTDAFETRLGDAVRCAPGTTLAARVEALVADPACEAIVVATTSADAARDGLPVDRFGVALTPARLPDSVEAAVAHACREVVRASPANAIDATALSAALGRMLGRYAACSSSLSGRNPA